MKLKNKLYLTQIFLILTLSIFLWVLYGNFKEHSQNDLEQQLTKSININTLLLTSALEDTYTILEQNKNIIKRIHRVAIDELKKDENISLDHLKTKMRSLFNLQYIDIDFYIINKEYVITDATFEKDIGLDFKEIPDGKMALDHASKDNEIHIAQNIAIDYIDSTFKLYSCAKVNNDKYLEMALIDPLTYDKLHHRLENIAKSTQNGINLFRIRKTTSNEEYYEDILNTRVGSNKKTWNDALKKFPLKNITDDEVINAKRQNTIIRNDKNIKNNKISIYIPILSKENDASLGHNHFVMKLKVDISEYSIQWQKNESIFILATLSLLVLMIFLYIFIKYNFYIPINIFTQSLENEVMIDNPDILNKNDEFGVLSKKYNLLYLNLQNQIKHNQVLLNENKQFITDMVHQIRTPLTVIMTNTSLIEMKTKENVSSYIVQINSAINMLSNSYEDLSYIISNDTIEYKPIEINLTNFLHQRVDFFEPISQANGKKINSNIADDINISMNDVELERLIDNNLSNAIKHSYNDTEIEVLLEKNHSEILLKFISKGQKIHNNSKIFNKGYTESYGAKRSLGLGLDMVKMICEKNNIAYSVRSEDSYNIFTYTFKV